MSHISGRIVPLILLFVFSIIFGGIYIFKANIFQLSFFLPSPIARSVACKMLGGKSISGNRESGSQCIFRYIDGGRFCTNSSQCLGGCVTDKPENLGKKGICRPSNERQGCLTEITQSRVWCLSDDIMMPMGY